MSKFNVPLVYAWSAESIEGVLDKSNLRVRDSVQVQSFPTLVYHCCGGLARKGIDIGVRTVLE